jgi:hypothetical protein
MKLIFFQNNHKKKTSAEQKEFCNGCSGRLPLLQHFFKLLVPVILLKYFYQGDFFGFFYVCTLFKTASSAAPQYLSHLGCTLHRGKRGLKFFAYYKCVDSCVAHREFHQQLLSLMI